MTQGSLASYSNMDVIPFEYIPLSGIYIQDSNYLTVAHNPPKLKKLPGYWALNNSTTGGQYEVNALLSAGGTFDIEGVFDGNQMSCSEGIYVHSDILLATPGSSTSLYGHNLRQTGTARNINGSAGNVTRMYHGGSTNNGWTAFSALPTQPYYASIQCEDARYLVAPASANTTYPTLADPTTAPTLAQSTGGYLADTTYYVKLAWVTKTNIYRCAQGITLPTSEANIVVSAGSGTASINVTVPQRPTNAVGYVVYIGTVSGTLYACGGGTGSASGTSTHNIKATMAALNMGNHFFYINSSSQIVPATITDLEATSPTYGTARTTTSTYNGLLWSPFFKDPTILYSLPTGGGAYNGLSDKFDIMAGTIALAQTLTVDGQPLRISSAMGAYWSTMGRNDVLFRSLPEMMAYALISVPCVASGYTKPHFVQIRSCLNNAILKSFAVEDTNPYNINIYNTDFHACGDFECVNGVTYFCVASRKHRGILRYPIRINE